MKVLNRKIVPFLLIASFALTGWIPRATGLSDPPGPKHTQTHGDSTLSKKAKMRSGLTHDIGPPASSHLQPRIDLRKNAKLLSGADSQVVLSEHERSQGNPQGNHDALTVSAKTKKSD